MKKNISLFLSVFLLLSVFAFSEKDKEDPFLINIKPAKLTSLKKEAFSWLDAHMTELCEINDKIWHFAEVAMEEYQSSELLASYLGKMGFKVTRNVAGMPTAFVAVYGSGEPVIGILAEYDALPGLSQQAVPYEKPFKAGASGHGCGHNIFGTSSTAAAVAIKQLMEKKGIEGTVKLFGCPAEETVVGKVFMARDGIFDGLSCCIQWHPSSVNQVSLGSSNALNQFEVEFFGKSAHSAGDPWDGRSALDAVELTDIGLNYLREHLRPTARIHYVIQDGGAAPNVFLTTGLGGGTGTGAIPVLANLASEMDILAIAIVTLPFDFEGKVRAKQAVEGLTELKSCVDTVISIPNERLLQTVNLDTSIQDAFRMADDILRQAVQGISDLITRPGLINLDFADVKSIMKGMGMAFMGTGIASGENRAVDAAHKAISSPLLIDTSIDGAHGVLINITGGKDITLHEVSQASELIYGMAHPEANIIFGTVIDENLKEMVKVTVIATGFDQPSERELVSSGKYTPPPIKRPPPFPAPQETPTYLFEPKGSNVLWQRPTWEKQWEPYETPSFIRNKHSSIRKSSRELG